MTPEEVIKWLRICASACSDDCKKCPYARTNGGGGCDQLLEDAATLLSATISERPPPPPSGAGHGVLAKLATHLIWDQDTVGSSPAYPTIGSTLSCVCKMGRFGLG